VLLVCGGENRRLVTKLMKLKLRKVYINEEHIIDTAIWRKPEDGSIGKVVILIWHPEYILRSRRLNVARGYDNHVNFAYDLGKAQIRRTYFLDMLVGAKAMNAEIAALVRGKQVDATYSSTSTKPIPSAAPTVVAETVPEDPL